jgi:hypothetical protein
MNEWKAGQPVADNKEARAADAQQWIDGWKKSV